MSQLCENTFVVKTKNLDKFIFLLNDYKDDIRINGVNTVYKDDEYSIVLFDSNGEPINHDCWNNNDYEYGETYYFDDNGIYTYSPKHNSNSTIIDLIKKEIILPKLNYNDRWNLLKKIKYSTEKEIRV